MAAILIVDDLAANRELMVRLLRDQGHRLLQAENGEEALAVVEAEVPDLVITDLLMPVMDGFELVRRLRVDPITSAVPVVFSTAYYDEREAKELALASGVSHVLTKPIGTEEVLRVINRVLTGSRHAPTATDDPSLATAFDREHLRLITDKLSHNVGELTLANSRLRALIHIGLDLASERDSTRALQTVCDAARELFDASYVTLGIVSRVSRTVEHFVSSGLETSAWLRPGDAPQGILRQVVDGPRTFRGDNPYGNPSRLDLPAGHPVIQAYVVAPVASPGLVYGWICLVNNEGRSFSDADEQLLLALAGQVGRIYESGHYVRLAEAERDRAQRYLDTAAVILLALDRDGRVTQANRYACAVLGWPAEELLGRDWADTCLPVSMRHRFKTKFKTTLLTTDSVVERPVLTRSGEERIIEWRNTVLRDEQGRPVGTFSSGTDVTVRVQAEKALRQTEERLAFALRQSHTGGWELDLRTQNAHRTAEHDRIFGYSSLLPMWTYEMFLEHIVPDDRAEVDRRFREAVETKTDWAFECRIKRADGETRWIWGTGGHQLGDDGQPRRLAGIVQDITVRKRAEEERRIAEERATFAMQNAGVGMWDMDVPTGQLRWSELMESHYGVKVGTFAGTFDAFMERIHPEDRASVLATIGQATRTGGDFHVEHRSLWPDGTVRWLSGRGRVLLGEHGEAVRAVGISLDVTDRRTLEEQYRQAQKMEAVGRLAGGIAHDFNNLLGVIMGSTELLLMDLDAGDSRAEDVVEIQKASERAAGLTRQLLAFSRKQIIEPTLLDLNTVVVDMLAMLRRLIGEDVSVTIVPGPEPARVSADRGQIEQVVMNLAVNARDAMPEGGQLTIETANVELDEEYLKRHVGVTPGRYASLIVSDTGTGIAPETQARIFEPFFTTKDVGKGTGLGLATVHGIVTGSGGTIDVYSELGVGTSFKVYFPRVEGAGEPIEAPAPPPATVGGTQTVLLVEDEEGLRDTTTKLLQRLGYTVLVASGAVEALALFEKHDDIDVILTDVVMPGGSGPELTRQLVPRRPTLKVVYMSGYTEEAIVHHGVLKPGIAFLNKPVTFDSLGRKLREVLDR